MADDAGEVAASHRQPQVLEHSGEAAGGGREALADALDRDELVSHGRSSVCSVILRREAPQQAQPAYTWLRYAEPRRMWAVALRSSPKRRAPQGDGLRFATSS